MSILIKPFPLGTYNVAPAGGAISSNTNAYESPLPVITVSIGPDITNDSLPDVTVDITVS